MSDTRLRGAEGEEAAVAWLRTNGFLIVDRNWRMGRYELDIVASRHDRIHFVEVKLRGAGGLTSPEEALTPAKRRALRAAIMLIACAVGPQSPLAHHGVPYDNRRAQLFGLRLGQCAAYLVGVVPVYLYHVPVPSTVLHGHILVSDLLACG